MYGFPAAQGFVPIRNDSNAVLASSYQTFPISIGYAQNIFTGDPVTLTGGYMTSLFDFIEANPPSGSSSLAANENSAGAPLLGIFMGVSYISSTDTTNPAQPIRPYWPASTVTADGANAIGYYLPVNYEYGFTCQSLLTAPSQAIVGKWCPVKFSATGTNTGLVNGNTSTGQSLCTVDLAAGVLSSKIVPWTNATTNSWSTFEVEALDYTNGKSGAEVQYGNVIIRLTNSAFPITFDHA